MSDQIKMADVFELPVSVNTVDPKEIEGINTYVIEDSVYRACLNYDHANHIAHAVNSHDRLTAENEALRSRNDDLIQELRIKKKDIKNLKEGVRERSGLAIESVQEVAALYQDELKALREEVERLRASRDAEAQWEKLMMRLVGEDGLVSVEMAVAALVQERDQLNSRWTRFNEVMGQIHQECDGSDEFDDDTIPAVLWELWRSPETSLAAHDAYVIERACDFMECAAMLGAYRPQDYSGLRDYANQLRQQANEVKS